MTIAPNAIIVYRSHHQNAIVVTSPALAPMPHGMPVPIGGNQSDHHSSHHDDSYTDLMENSLQAPNAVGLSGECDDMSSA